jgi:hypothetical protein
MPQSSKFVSSLWANIKGIASIPLIIAGTIAAYIFGLAIYEFAIRFFIASVAACISIFIVKWSLFGAVWLLRDKSKPFYVTERSFEPIAEKVGIAVAFLVFAGLLVMWFPEWKAAYDYFMKK